MAKKFDATQALSKRTSRPHPNAERAKAAMAETEQKQLKAIIPASLHARFKARAATEQLSMNEIIIELLTDYLESE